MKPYWAKFTVVGHRCGIGISMYESVFYASTIASALAFQSAWGGRIT